MANAKNEQLFIPAFERINSFHKLLICAAIAVAVYFIVEIKNIDLLTHVMIGWDTFSVGMITMSWITFFITNSKQIRQQSKVQDSGRSIVFIFVVRSTLAGFLAVLFLSVTRRHENGG